MTEKLYNEEGEEINEYGNPVDGDTMPYCQSPACGCDESRLCMAEDGFDKRYRGDFFSLPLEERL